MRDCLAIGIIDESNDTLKPVKIQRRNVEEDDVEIKIKYCGICHSDLHYGRDQWGHAKRPAVPGHEIVGEVIAVGKNVAKFKPGDAAGVGPFIGSCGKCRECTCSEKLTQYCSGPTGPINCYGSADEKEGHTKGGYSQFIVIKQDFVLKIPENLDIAAVCPLLCAGVTTWSPLIYYGVKKGDRVGVLGLGGLGHMAVKFAKAFGCEVVVLSRSRNKTQAALKLGADSIVITTHLQEMKAVDRSFDFILDTVSEQHILENFLSLLKTDGTLILVGAGPDHLPLLPISLIQKRIKVAGSLVGGIKETQEMLDFCGKHNIVSDIELVPVDYVNQAWERMLRSDVRFRFVLDVETTLNDQ